MPPLSPNPRIAHLWLADSYAQLGQSAKARAAAPDVLHIEPNFTINRWKRTAVYRNPEDAERLYDGVALGDAAVMFHLCSGALSYRAP